MPVLYGVRYGPNRGVRYGQGVGFLTAAGPTDPGSGKSVPLTQADWNAVDTAAGFAPKTVAHTHACQDAAGNPAATVGATALTATGLVYQQPISGWDRDGLGFDAGTTDAATFAAGTGPDPATVSCLWFGYVDFTATVGATRQVLAVGGAAGATECTARQMTTQAPQIKVLAATATGSVVMEPGGMIPLFLGYNPTSNEGVVITPGDYVTLSGDGVTDGVKGWGAGVAITSAPFLLALSAAWSGANAELTQAQHRSRLQAMGWSTAW